MQGAFDLKRTIEGNNVNIPNVANLSRSEQAQVNIFDEQLRNYQEELSNLESHYKNSYNSKKSKIFDILRGFDLFKLTKGIQERYDLERSNSREEIKNLKNLILDTRASRSKLISDLIGSSNRFLNSRDALIKANLNPLLLAENLQGASSFPSFERSFSSNLTKNTSNDLKDINGSKSGLLALLLLLFKLLG